MLSKWKFGLRLIAKVFEKYFSFLFLFQKDFYYLKKQTNKQKNEILFCKLIFYWILTKLYISIDMTS